MKKVIFFLIILLAVPIFCFAEANNNVLGHYNNDHSNCFVFSGVSDGIIGNFKIEQNGIDVTNKYTQSLNMYVLQINEGSYINIKFIEDLEKESNNGKRINFISAHRYLNGNTFYIYDENLSSSGKCGDNMYWSLDLSGNLTITGNGAMYNNFPIDFDQNENLWNSRFVYSVTINDGIESIGDHVFESAPLTNIIIPKSVKLIGQNVFMDSSISTIVFQGNAPCFNDIAFQYTTCTIYYPPDDSSWDSVIDKNYHGTITWLPYCHHNNIVVDARIEPTCTENGFTEGQHCADCNTVIIQQQVIPSIGHSLTKTDKVDATCLVSGTEEYWTCSVCNKMFMDSNGESEIGEPAIIPKTGHTWGEASYVWSSDNRSITATHICTVDNSHKEIITVAVNAVITSPTKRSRGSAVYASESFNAEGFKQQSKTLLIPMLKNMSVINLPIMLTEIEDEAFKNIDCEAVIIPNNCTSIGKDAFANCENLLYVKAPSWIDIDPDAFAGCEDVVVDLFD